MNTKQKLRRNQRIAKMRKRLENPPPDYPKIMPKLRRIVIVIDFDFGTRVETFRLWRTNRVDCYRMTDGNGNLINKRIGWSKVLEEIRTRFARVKSVINT